MQGKIDILAAYEGAKIKASIHEVKTFHGIVAEAELRKWLINFLPKRFGVTSGFIVSSDPTFEGRKLPHFDVIIYDQLESPILWLDNHPDANKQGVSQAVPVEYVKGILEVKARWTPKAAKEAIAHLHDLDELMLGQDAPGDSHKRFLPCDFFCGVVFFEVLKKNMYCYSALDKLLDLKLRGYIGAIVLQGEGLFRELTGRIEILRCTFDQPRKSEIGKHKSSLLYDEGFPWSNSVEGKTGQHYCAGLKWLGMNFADWAFDLLARLQGEQHRKQYVWTWRTSHLPKKP